MNQVSWFRLTVAVGRVGNAQKVSIEDSRFRPTGYRQGNCLSIKSFEPYVFALPQNTKLLMPQSFVCGMSVVAALTLSIQWLDFWNTLIDFSCSKQSGPQPSNYVGEVVHQ